MSNYTSVKDIPDDEKNMALALFVRALGHFLEEHTGVVVTIGEKKYIVFKSDNAIKFIEGEDDMEDGDVTHVLPANSHLQ